MDKLIELIKKRASNPETIHDMSLGLSPAPKIGPKADPADVEKIEDDLGFKLPVLLKRIYVEIGDGGFGPGYGLYSLKTAVEIYLKSVSSDETKKGKFPICTWGCAKDSFIDVLNDKFPVMIEKTGESDDCECMENLKFKLTDKDGNVISSGNGSLNDILNGLGGGSTKRASINQPKKAKKFMVHKNSIEEWFSDWVNGADLWSDMERL
jgi:hypothetical protein